MHDVHLAVNNLISSLSLPSHATLLQLPLLGMSLRLMEKSLISGAYPELKIVAAQFVKG